MEIDQELREQHTRTTQSTNNTVIVFLIVPAFVLLDTTVAWLRGQIALKPLFPDAMIGGIAGLWLVTGLGLLFLSRNRRVFAARVATPLLTIYTFYLGLGVAEAFRRMIHLTPIPSLEEPLTRAVFHMDPAITPGVSGTKVLTINPLGLRGPMPPRDGQAYRILTVGAAQPSRRRWTIRKRGLTC